MPCPRKRRKRRKRRNQRALKVGVILVVLLLPLWCGLDWLLTPNVVVRVLFAETANCTPQERMLVAGVMKNRVGNPAFGNAWTLKAVVLQPGAFSCIGDSSNANWGISRHPALMTSAERIVWKECLACVSGNIPSAVGPSGRLLVYYHDRSISKPATWDNAAWRAIREQSTEHFVFYSIVPAEHSHH
jgi:Cell Wall Hydrolase